MKAEFAPLAEALRERLVIISDHAHRDHDPRGHLDRLREVSQRIDSIVSSLSDREIDMKFRHYLDRRSYDKALAWIVGTGS